MSYPNWVFSAFSFLGFVLVCIPFPWHFEAWNTGTCIYMMWTGLACLNLFINSIVWNGNAINWAPVWCDISSKLIVAEGFAMPAAALCINRRLYNIASVQSVTITRAEKRRNILVDLAIGVGLPVLGMILHYIPQGHRFDIVEDVGCWPFTYFTWVGYLIMHAFPLTIALISTVYAVLAVRAFNRTRLQSKEVLSSYSNLTSSRYLRLMALAGVDILFDVPLNIIAIAFNATSGRSVYPWISWADTHSGFSRVDQYPALLWRATSRGSASIELSRWVFVVAAFTFFGFFGFADEAKKNYRTAFSSVAKRMGYSTGSFGGSTAISSTSMSKGGISSHSGALPVFIKEKLTHKPSFDSFSDGTASFSDGSLSSPTITEKASTIGSIKKKAGDEIFSPSFHYDDLPLPDIGGTLADNSSLQSSPVISASTISIPQYAVTRGADISIHRLSRVSLPEIQVSHAAASAAVSVPESNSHNMV